MELNQLAVALHGIGYTTFLVAVQGLWGLTIVPPLRPIATALPPPMITPRRKSGRRRVLTFRQLPVEETDDEEALLLGIV